MKISKPFGTTQIFEILSSSEGKRIIGIDPGLNNLGIGIISIQNNALLGKKEEKKEEKKRGRPRTKEKKEKLEIRDLAKFVNGYAYALIKTKAKATLPKKLNYIYKQLLEIFEKFPPDLIIVEDAFIGINPSSGLRLGLARGCILTAIGKFDTLFETHPPKQIKMEFASDGNAKKEEIREIFKTILPNFPDSDKISLDCSDALATAFCGIKFIIDREA